MQPKQMPLRKCIQATVDFSHSLRAVCFSCVLRSQVDSSCSSMWILKDPNASEEMKVPDFGAGCAHQPFAPICI